MFKWPWSKRSADTARRSLPTYGQFAGAQISRFVDFYNALEVAHKERLKDLRRLRAHSRDLVKNNVYAARYSGLVATNLVGPDGVNLQSEIKGAKDQPKNNWNKAIEAAWKDWGRCCTVDGQSSWVEVQQLVAQMVSTDGEVLIRLVRGYPNACGFAIEVIDADRLDDQWNRPLQNGSRIIGGVEVDAWGRRQAYWIMSAHPQDWDAAPQRVRVPAGEIIHLYREDRVQGFRGIPWITPCMVQLNMVSRLWTSELVAANWDADRVGVIHTQTGWDPQEVNDPAKTASEMPSDMGTIVGLDPGQDITFPSPQHPNSVLPQFTAYLLKGSASGLNVAYHSLTGDLAESKFSSDRTALVQERDGWRLLQGWLIRRFCSPIYQAWLELAMFSGVVSIPVADPARACAPRWAARNWDWVDPLKDVQASTQAISFGLSTYQDELGAQGKDWEELFEQRAREQAKAKQLGLVLEAKPSTTVTTNTEPGQEGATAPAGEEGA